MKLVCNGVEVEVPDPPAAEVRVDLAFPKEYMDLIRLISPIASDAENVMGIVVEWMVACGLIELELEGRGKRKYDPEFLRAVSSIPDPWNT